MIMGLDMASINWSNIVKVVALAILSLILLSGSSGAFPSPVLLKINANEQTGGFIASCWNSMCSDGMGITTSAEPLITRSPFIAHLTLPLQEPPEWLELSAGQVMDKNKYDTAEGTYSYEWNIEWNKAIRYNVSLERESDINITLSPGLYVLGVDAKWKGKGYVFYEFLVQVYEPESDSADASTSPALLKINGNEQTSGIGSYCWNIENETTRICKDANGIITPREPLITISPFTAHLRLQLEEPPQDLGFRKAIVTDKNESYGARNDFFRVWNFSSNEWIWHTLPSGNESEIDLSLPPGLYVLDVDAKWKDKGSVSYGFLVQVYDPDAKITNVSSVEKTAGFEFFLAITALSMAIMIWRKRR